MEPEQAPSPFGGTSLTVSVYGRAPADSDELVMAWARDRETGALRYILELSANQRGARSGCQCISCNLPLMAVNAAKATYKRRPHFRHPAGAQKDSCLMLAARAALRHAMQPGDVIVLPRRRRSVRVEGLSGDVYEAWVEQPSESVRISSVEFKDGIKALLVLDDGRELEVQLVGSADLSETTAIGITPRILILVDDPAIAGMPPDEIRRRLVPLLDHSTWCGHWRDEFLDEQAREAALDAADEALDWDTEHADLTADLRRESLLHREVKAILESARRLRLPGWTVKDDRSSQYGGSRQASTPPTMAVLHGATLECRLGRIIPDVVAQLATGGELLIEVTVTNHITPERLGRIREVNLPTLEIDVSRMGGCITRSQLALLIIEEVAGKVWLHHPAMEAQRGDLLAEVDVESRCQVVSDTERREIRRISLDEWVQRYLSAVVQHAALRWEDAPPDNGEHECYVTQALEDVEECALALHEYGYPEARDDRLYSGAGRTIIERLLSIQLDTGVGYKHDTGWQVINAILQDISATSKSWHSLYLIAIKVYRPRLSEAQKIRVNQWRTEVRGSIQTHEDAYLRDPKYDDFLALLFPGMQEALANPFGRLDLQDNRISRRQQIVETVRAAPTAPANTFRNAPRDPGDDYFEGANERRWMWVQPGHERVERAKSQLERLIKPGIGEAARSTLQALIAPTMSDDPRSFALALQHQYRFEKARTLRYLFSLGLIIPVAE